MFLLPRQRSHRLLQILYLRVSFFNFFILLLNQAILGLNQVFMVFRRDTRAASTAASRMCGIAAYRSRPSAWTLRTADGNPLPDSAQDSVDGLQIFSRQTMPIVGAFGTVNEGLIDTGTTKDMVARRDDRLHRNLATKWTDQLILTRTFLTEEDGRG